MFITPSFKKSLVVEQFQGNYLNSLHTTPGRLHVGRWNERIRAKRCDAVDWGLPKRTDLHSNLDF